jgi:RNA polymerase sigma factor (sigma-70 family)
MADEPRAEHPAAAILAEHGREMLRRARRALGSDADADDAVQEVMLSLVRAPHVLGAVERIGAWLLALVHRRCVDLVRVDRRREGKETAGGAGGSPLGADPAELAEQEELARAVARAVDALPEELRRAFVGNALEEKTFREMSAESGVPMGTLMARKARAVDLLRAELRRRGFVE